MNDTTLAQQETMVKQFTEAYLWIEQRFAEMGLEVRSGFFGFVVINTTTDEVELARDLRGLIEFLVKRKAVQP